MTDTTLTTDIIVIVVLVVVLGKFNISEFQSAHILLNLVLIGVCAFCAHFYWTKIGVSEIWNTAKWSSMRSSFYRTVGRLSRANSAKSDPGRPLSPASLFSQDNDPELVPTSISKTKTTANSGTGRAAALNNISNNQFSSNQTGYSNPRRNSINQIQPVKTTSYTHTKQKHGDQDTGIHRSGFELTSNDQTDPQRF